MSPKAQEEGRRRLRSLKVHQWLSEWEEVEFIDDPSTVARIAHALMHSRREDIAVALNTDDHLRSVGHDIVATGWIQAARPSAWQFIAGNKV